MNISFRKSLVKSLAVLASCFTLTAQANLIDVDVELQLLADVSGSVNSTEYALQLEGYANAFRNQAIIDLITDTSDGRLGSIAVQFIEWSTASQQSVQVDWMLINSAATAIAFANQLDALSRAFSGLTAVGSAIEFGYPLFFNNNFNGTRLVMDVSGDGIQNNGVDTITARNNALQQGIDSINGITIGSSLGLTDWYSNNVVGGSKSFVINAASFADFETGITQKLAREISGKDVPTPATLGLFGSGLLLLAFRRKAR